MPELPQIALPTPPSPPNGIVQPRPTLGADITQDADSMRWVLHEAQRDEEVATISNGIGKYLIKAGDIEKQLAPVTDGEAYYRDYSSSLMAAADSIANEVPAGPLRDRLAAELKVHVGDDINTHGVPTAVRLKVQSARASIGTALSTYTLSAVNATDPKDRDYSIQQAHGLIDADQYWNPAEKQQQHLEFDHNVDKGGLQKSLQDDPSAAMTEFHSPDFTKNHPLITPEEHEQLVSQATTQAERGYKAFDMQLAAERGATESQIMQMAAQGKPIAAALEAAAPKGLVSPDFYKRFTGHPFQQTMPGVRDAFDAQIKLATSPADLDSITESAAMAQEAGTLSAKDASIIQLTAGHMKTQLGQADKAAQASFNSAMYNKYFPPKSAMSMVDPTKPKLSAEAFTLMRDASWANHRGDPVAAAKELGERIDQVMGPASPATPAIGRLLGGK